MRAAEVIKNRIVWMGTGAVMMAAIGAVVTLAASGAFASTVVVADRISFVYGDFTTQDMPQTTEAAVSSGWNGSIRCFNGMGRFYRTFTDDRPDPLMLIYDHEDELIGVNLHSPVEQPSPPWLHLPIGIRTAFAGRDAEHWGVSVYVRKPVDACDLQYRADDDDR